MSPQPHTFDTLVILGPTASGKTRLAVEAARLFSGEIVSADSRQVFRAMDIGTGKDLAEYGEVPHHLIDVAEPGEEFSLFRFLQLFNAAWSGIRERGRLPILAGGTGLYIDAVMRGYRMVEAPENPALRQESAELSLDDLLARLSALKPDLHNTTDTGDRERLVRALEIALHEREHPEDVVEPPKLQPLVVGIRWEREELRRRITARLKERLATGMVEEVEGLLQAGVAREALENYGLEYRFVSRFLAGELSRNDMFQKLNAAIHDFAKRQETWFRRMEKHGVAIRWIDGGNDAVAQLMRVMEES